MANPTTQVEEQPRGVRFTDTQQETDVFVPFNAEGVVQGFRGSVQGESFSMVETVVTNHDSILT